MTNKGRGSPVFLFVFIFLKPALPLYTILHDKSILVNNFSIEILHKILDFSISKFVHYYLLTFASYSVIIKAQIEGGVTNEKESQEAIQENQKTSQKIMAAYSPQDCTVYSQL